MLTDAIKASRQKRGPVANRPRQENGLQPVARCQDRGGRSLRIVQPGHACAFRDRRHPTGVAAPVWSGGKAGCVGECVSDARCFDGACGPCQGGAVPVYNHAQMSIEIAALGTTNIQALHRVALDGHLLETPNLRESDAMQIELDVPNATIIMRKTVDARLPPMSRFAEA